MKQNKTVQKYVDLFRRATLNQVADSQEVADFRRAGITSPTQKALLLVDKTDLVEYLEKQDAAYAKEGKIENLANAYQATIRLISFYPDEVGLQEATRKAQEESLEGDSINTLPPGVNLNRNPQLPGEGEPTPETGGNATE